MTCNEVHWNDCGDKFGASSHQASSACFRVADYVPYSTDVLSTLQRRIRHEIRNKLTTLSLRNELPAYVHDVIQECGALLTNLDHVDALREDSLKEGLRKATFVLRDQPVIMYSLDTRGDVRPLRVFQAECLNPMCEQGRDAAGNPAPKRFILTEDELHGGSNEKKCCSHACTKARERYMAKLPDEIRASMVNEYERRRTLLAQELLLGNLPGGEWDVCKKV